MGTAAVGLWGTGESYAKNFSGSGVESLEVASNMAASSAAAVGVARSGETLTSKSRSNENGEQGEISVNVNVSKEPSNETAPGASV